MENDDTEIWEEVKRSVRPLKGKRAATTASRHKQPARKQSVLPSEKPSASPRPTPSGPLPVKQIRKLRRQEIPVEATLDLHGMSAEKAHMALTRFLARVRQKNMRCVEIITGRGDPLRGTGKLRRQLPLWLELETGILHVEENPHTRGGSFLIMLRRTRNKTE